MIHPEQFKPILGDAHIKEVFHPDNTLNMDALREHPLANRMAERHLAMFEEAHKRGLVQQATEYYPREHEIAKDIGKRFNDARARSGKKLYFPDQPEQAGALIGGQLSQSNREERRVAMVNHAAKTGDVPKWISTPRIMHAIKNDIPAVDAAPPMKLRDYTGSILHPHEWSGGGIGTGHTGDRLMHDIGTGVRWGDRNRGIAQQDKPSDVRRYRFLQGTMALAHERYDPKLPAPAAQSIPWHGYRALRDE